MQKSSSKSRQLNTITVNPNNCIQPLNPKPYYPLSAYGPKLKVSITFPCGEGRTKQSFKDECDINNIMARYQKTGVLDFAGKHQAQYGDCTNIEFQAGLDIISNAKKMFADLPSSVRRRFDNDPGEFLEFINDAGNREEAQRMGLLKESTPPTAPPPRLRGK